MAGAGADGHSFRQWQVHNTLALVIPTKGNSLYGYESFSTLFVILYNHLNFTLKSYFKVYKAVDFD